MSIDLWLAFLAAAIVLLIIPGPTILLVVSMLWGRAGARPFPFP
jgi:homoserine/homoserine lactone efflux protein